MKQFILRLYWKWWISRQPHHHRKLHDMFEIEMTRDMLRDVHRRNWR